MGVRQSESPLQTLFNSGTIAGLSDAQLLDRFVSRREEVVFEAILQRHGPMVWGVCRRILRDHHDAEDAFQASFLVLARKAASIMPREQLVNWLYGVAYQTARKAKAITSRRRAREKQVPDLPVPEGAVREDRWDDLLSLLDHEVSRLPEKYRTPIVLCGLGDKTHKQAAEELGWPVGTLSGRLSRARSILARRLTRRGVALAGGLSAALLAQGSASASVPLSLVTSTSWAATKIAAGQAAAGLISETVAALTERVLKGMLMTRIKIATMVLLLGTMAAAGTRPFDFSRRAEAAKLVQAVEDFPSNLDQTQARSGGITRKARGSDEEMKQLEGTWAVTDVVEAGVRATAEQKAKGLGTVVIQGDRLTMFSNTNSHPGTSFTIDVDPTHAPRIMGLIPLNDKQEEDRHQAIRLAIYELKGDTLTICAGVDRPESFEVVPGSKQDLLVLKWAKR